MFPTHTKMQLGGGGFFLLLFFFAAVVVADLFLSFLVTFFAVDSVVVVPPFALVMLRLTCILLRRGEMANQAKNAMKNPPQAKWNALM